MNNIIEGLITLLPVNSRRRRTWSSFFLGERKKNLSEKVGAWDIGFGVYSANEYKMYVLFKLKC